MTEQEVLAYIHNSLLTNISGIELSDDQILEHIRTVVLPEFSHYIPDEHGRLVLDTEAEAVQTAHPNEYKLYDPEGRRIISINEVIFPDFDIMFGYNPIGIFNYESIPNFELETSKARATRLYSLWNFTYDFIPPNILRIMPQFQGTCTVLYNREHAPDFSTIPIAYQREFLEYCLGSVMVAIGRARTRFGSVQTSFGEIQLNGSDWMSQGQDILSNLKEKLELIALPSIEIDVG
ncbi:MAG: hypothetical protein GXO10_04900 [Crenarchaeota archaeon]|nr:hypothetical protein [Thermoproteota archaeon]